MAMNASFKPAYFFWSLCEMAKLEGSGEFRSSNRFSVTKTIPALELLMKPLHRHEARRHGCALPLRPSTQHALCFSPRLTAGIGRARFR